MRTSERPTHILLYAPVQHLKGGIHRYMEAFDTHGLWKGKNFVFDRRVAMGPEG